MVKHIILWQLKEEFSPEQKAEIRAGIKEHLEALVGKVPGLLEVPMLRYHWAPREMIMGTLA